MAARPYRVLGPFVVPFGPNGYLEYRNLSGFWTQLDQVRKGISTWHSVYIFAMRAGRGYRPWYVGKATGKRGFAQEVFAPHKLVHYNAVANGYRRGTPVLFLVYPVTPLRSALRRASAAEVEWVEQHLIQAAIDANPDLRNLRDTQFAREVQIPGVLNAARAGAGVTHFLRVLNRASMPIRDRITPTLEREEQTIVAAFDVEPAEPDINVDVADEEVAVPERKVSPTLEFLFGYALADRFSVKTKKSEPA